MDGGNKRDRKCKRLGQSRAEVRGRGRRIQQFRVVRGCNFPLVHSLHGCLTSPVFKFARFDLRSVIRHFPNNSPGVDEKRRNRKFFL